jgi:hypothetical protein
MADYEDRYNPKIENDIDKVEVNDNYDPGCSKFVNTVKKPNGKMRKQVFKIYNNSNDPGARLRDAVTGVFFNDRVGTTDEKKYFKVAVATGKIKAKNESNSFYYLTPEDFSRHFKVDVNTETQESWHKRQL